MTGVDWEHLLGTLNVDDPSVGQVAEAYADATDTSISQAYERVETALGAGGLVERNRGGTFPTVAVPETPNIGEGDPEDHDSRHECPRLEAIEPAPTGTDRGADNVPRHPECLADAFEFFHHKLDADISDHQEDDRIATPRDYFQKARGWTDEMIAERQLGWAPADMDALRDHLHELGYNREEMLATGPFSLISRQLVVHVTSRRSHRRQSSRLSRGA